MIFYVINQTNRKCSRLLVSAENLIKNMNFSQMISNLHRLRFNEKDAFNMTHKNVLNGAENLYRVGNLL